MSVENLDNYRTIRERQRITAWQAGVAVDSLVASVDTFDAQLQNILLLAQETLTRTEAVTSGLVRYDIAAI